MAARFPEGTKGRPSTSKVEEKNKLPVITVFDKKLRLTEGLLNDALHEFRKPFKNQDLKSMMKSYEKKLKSVEQVTKQWRSTHDKLKRAVANHHVLYDMELKHHPLLEESEDEDEEIESEETTISVPRQKVEEPRGEPEKPRQ